ncbi:MAG: hypothetical protein ACK41T_11480 [Pseudobdellovibrio sp.]
MSEFFKFKKAAFKHAAFLLLSVAFFNGANAQKVSHGSKTHNLKNEDVKFNEIKNKITSLLLLKQRNQALEQLLDMKIPAENIEIQGKISKLKLNVLTVFFNPEAQDLFEIAASQYINQSKVAIKSAQKCIALEGENLFCLWAEVKALGLDKNQSRYIDFKDKMLAFSKNVPELYPLYLSMDKKSKIFLEYKIDLIKNELYDSNVLSAILEYDRAILVKNYSLAKESLMRIQDLAPDYVDLTLMKAKLDLKTYGEESRDKYEKVVEAYKKKCESVPIDVARRYFFDIDFCKRSLD